MARSFGTRGRGSSRASGRSPTEWGAFQVSTSVVSSGSIGKWVIIPNSRVADLTEPTLVRVRGAIGCSSAGSGIFTWGIIVVDSTLSTTGANLSPVGDGDADWLAWGAFALGTAGTVVGATGTADGASAGTIDSKAMRKLNENDEVVMYGQATTATFTISHVTRFLLMQVGKR